MRFSLTYYTFPWILEGQNPGQQWDRVLPCPAEAGPSQQERDHIRAGPWVGGRPCQAAAGRLVLHMYSEIPLCWRDASWSFLGATGTTGPFPPGGLSAGPAGNPRTACGETAKLPEIPGGSVAAAAASPVGSQLRLHDRKAHEGVLNLTPQRPKHPAHKRGWPGPEFVHMFGLRSKSMLLF